MCCRISLQFPIGCHSTSSAADLRSSTGLEIPLAEIKAIKQACGATVNDVVLTVVTSTVRRYAELHGVRLKGQRVRIIVPVNIRGNEQATDLGNRITFIPVDIPLDIVDPRKLIDAVRAAVARARSAHLAELVGLLGSWLATIPNALQALVGPLVSQLPLSLCNLICTNVPGPQIPLYFLGHRLLACHPYVPIGGEMGMNCAVLTYDGTAFFGFTGDAQAIPDLRLLDKLLSASFAELLKAVGFRRPRRNPRADQATGHACFRDNAVRPQSRGRAGNDCLSGRIHARSGGKSSGRQKMISLKVGV